MNSGKELGELLRSALPDVDTALSAYVESVPPEEQRDRQRVVQKALNYLNGQTFGRIDGDLEEDVLRCCGEALLHLLDVLESYREMEAKKGLNSETIGGWSRSYAAGADLRQNEESELRAVLWRALGWTDLLYRGWD